MLTSFAAYPVKISLNKANSSITHGIISFEHRYIERLIERVTQNQDI